MRPLTSEEVASMKAAHEGLFDTTCGIYHTSRTEDGQGGWIDTEYPDPQNPFPCSRGPAKALGEYELAGALAGREVCEIRLAEDAPVTGTDVIQIGNERYEILGIARRSRRVVLRLLCASTA